MCRQREMLHPRTRSPAKIFEWVIISTPVAELLSVPSASLRLRPAITSLQPVIMSALREYRLCLAPVQGARDALYHKGQVGDFPPVSNCVGPWLITPFAALCV